MLLPSLLIVVLNLFCTFSQEVIYYPSKEVLYGRTTDSKKSFSTFNQLEFLNGSIKKHQQYRHRRGVDPTFHGHPKTQEEMWVRAFHGQNLAYNQIPSLVNLLHMLATKHLYDCVPVILYDRVVEDSEGLLLQQLMKKFPSAYVHGRISKDNSISEFNILKAKTDRCVSYILFLADVMVSADVLGLQATSRVIVVARSSQWRVQEFLFSKLSRYFVNLLIVAQSFRDDVTLETPYILYTHNLFIDGLGTSKPEVLTSWARGKLARPKVDLFPPKMVKGYAGHRFSVIAANQPPFVFKRIYTDNLGNRRVSWEGIEFRLLTLLGHRNNFSIEIKEPQDLSVGSGDSVGVEIDSSRADIGIGGLYVTADRLFKMDMSTSHSQDCAVFISLTSTALPKYRAIMGPFHWTVWLALTLTYLFGIFPLAFSDKHTLKHLIHNSGEIENMFWYVFGTFTNCFTFVGKNSWSKTTKITTRLLIGWYWIFTIIITACYTGSIIAFVTLPVYPATVDTVKQLLSGNYRVGTLDRGGWENWFANSSDKYTKKLLRHLELVPDIEAGLMNTTKAFFWSYAFLGSKYQLEYVVQSNFTFETSKRAVLHISDECFVPFGVSIAFPKESVYTEKLNKGILRMIQSGIVAKMVSDVKWDMQRSSSGKLLQAGTGASLRTATIEERGLSLRDTQGMFLLLGVGFLGAGAALLSEWFGGCGRMCRGRRRVSSATTTISSTSALSQIAPTPNSKTDVSDYGDVQLESSTGSDKEDAIQVMTPKKPAIETFHINVDEYKDDDENVDAKSADSDINNAYGKSLEVSTDVAQVHVGNELSNGSGHSRRSSSVDWDHEINQLFPFTRSEIGSDEEPNKLTVLEENITTEATEAVERDDVDNSVTILFGEHIPPPQVSDQEQLIVEDLASGQYK